MGRQSDFLIVVDLQIDFCPGGALPVPGADEIVPVVDRLMRHIPRIVLSQDHHPHGHLSFASSHPGKQPGDTVKLAYGEQILWPDHCVAGSIGAAFHPRLRSERAEIVVRQGTNLSIDSYSAFFENDRKTRTGLSGYLKSEKAERLILCGLATDFCVLYSALDARQLGYETVVVTNACRGLDIDGSLEQAFDAMRDAGVELLTSKEVLDSR